MAQRNVTLPTVHHLGHLGGNAARRAPERRRVALVDRVGVYRPKALRATFPKTEDLEEVVDDAHHHVVAMCRASQPGVLAEYVFTYPAT